MAEPLPFTTLLFLDKEGKELNGVYTDEDGKASISFPVGEVPDSVHMNYVGSEKVRIGLAPSQSQNWEIVLYFSPYFPVTITTGTHIYEYRPLLGSGFKIRQLSPYEADDWIIIKMLE